MLPIWYRMQFFRYILKGKLRKKIDSFVGYWRGLSSVVPLLGAGNRLGLALKTGTCLANLLLNCKRRILFKNVKKYGGGRLNAAYISPRIAVLPPNDFKIHNSDNLCLCFKNILRFTLAINNDIKYTYTHTHTPVDLDKNSYKICYIIATKIMMTYNA